MTYFLIALVLFVLSVYYDIYGNTRGKSLWYNSMFFVFVFVAGMRYRIGIDTLSTCYVFYHETPKLSAFWGDFSIFQYPIWNFLKSLIYTCGGRFYMLQFVQSSIVNILIFKYVNKHSQYIFTCLFLYFIWKYPTYNFEEMKQTCAVVFSLFANDYILDRKYNKGMLLYLVACMFHFGAIPIFIVSYFVFLRFDYKGFIFIFLGLIIGIVMQTQFEEYLMLFGFDDYIQEKMEGYASSDRFFAILGKNFKFYIANFLILIVYVFLSFKYVKKYDNSSRILKFEPYLVLGLFFVVMNSAIAIFYRFTNYYSIYFVLFIAQVFVDIAKRERYRFTYIKSLLLFFPFFFYVAFTYIGLGDSDRYHKFYPYSSIIDMKIDKEREKTYSNHMYDQIYPPHSNEY